MNYLKKLSNRYEELSIPVKAGMWFTICNILQRGIQFIVTPIYTRLLTTEQYGEYSLFITWMNLLMIFATLNMSGGIYYNGIIKKEKDITSYTSSLQVLSAVCTLCTFSILFGINLIIPDKLDISCNDMLLMLIYSLLYPAIEFWSAQNRVHYNYKPILILTLLSSIIAPIISILLVLKTNMGGYGVILGFVLTNIVINGFLYVRNLIEGHFAIHISDWKETLRFSLPLIPHYLSQVVLGQFDRIMISYYCGESKAGIYTLAYQVGLVMSILTTGINNVFTPWIYQQIKAKQYDSLKKITNILLAFFLLVNIAIIMIAPEIVSILGTNDYKEAIWAIPPVMMSSFVMFAYCAFGTVLFYFEDTKRASIATTSGAILNVILNAICIPNFGYIAAGYTTLISYILIFVFYYIFMNRCCEKENIPILFDIKIILAMIGTLIFVSGGALLIYKTIVLRYLIVLGIAISGIIKRRHVFNMISSIRKGDRI